MNGEQRPGWYFAHAQADLDLHSLGMLKDTFSLDASHLLFWRLSFSASVLPHCNKGWYTIRWGDCLSRKHAYTILTPLQPHFYIIKLGFTGVYIMFLISAEAVLTSTHNLCFEQKFEKYQKFLSENFSFLVVKFSVYLNRRVFVMQNCFYLSFDRCLLT